MPQHRSATSSGAPLTLNKVHPPAAAHHLSPSTITIVHACPAPSIHSCPPLPLSHTSSARTPPRPAQPHHLLRHCNDRRLKSLPCSVAPTRRCRDLVFTCPPRKHFPWRSRTLTRRRRGPGRGGSCTSQLCTRIACCAVRPTVPSPFVGPAESTSRSARSIVSPCIHPRHHVRQPRQSGDECYGMASRQRATQQPRSREAGFGQQGALRLPTSSPSPYHPAILALNARTRSTCRVCIRAWTAAPVICAGTEGVRTVRVGYLPYMSSLYKSVPRTFNKFSLSGILQYCENNFSRAQDT